MQNPDRYTPIARCEALSLYAQHALRRYQRLFDVSPAAAARLESLAATLAAATDPLIASQAAYRAAVLALLAPRVEVKLVDLKADAVVRSVKRAAEDAGAEVDAAVFPEGATPIVKPVGAAEVAGLRSLSGRIAATPTWADREAQRARVDGVHGEYSAALAARSTAMAVAADARAVRDEAKERFLDAYVAVASAIKELFPRDRIRQDVFFDDVRAGSRAQDDGDEPDEPATPVG